MTVKDLKEKLSKYPDGYIVLIPNENLYKDRNPLFYIPAENVSRGINEMDGYIIIYGCVEE